MAKIALPGIGHILTTGTNINATGKTLIITAHGRMTGTKFKPAYTTVIEFASPAYGALIADLKDCINGKVTAQGIAKIEGDADDHSLAFFEKDPGEADIIAALKGSKYDILQIDPSVKSTRQNNSPKLSEVILALLNAGCQYTGLLCVFCRVEKDVATGATLKSHTVVGKVHASAAMTNQLMKNQLTLGQELKAKLAGGAAKPSNF